MCYNLPSNDIGTSHVYIGDVIGVALDINNNVLCINRAIPLALSTLARPINELASIPHKGIISIKKQQAEGKMEEVKTVLG